MTNAVWHISARLRCYHCAARQCLPLKYPQFYGTSPWLTVDFDDICCTRLWMLFEMAPISYVLAPVALRIAACFGAEDFTLSPLPRSTCHIAQLAHYPLESFMTAIVAYGSVAMPSSKVRAIESS